MSKRVNSFPGIVLAAGQSGSEEHNNNNAPSTIDIEGGWESGSREEESGDPWARSRVVREETPGDLELPPPSETPEAGFSDGPGEFNGTRPAEPAPAVLTGDPEKKESAAVSLETDQWKIDLDVVGVEINYPFFILIDDKAPAFTPKGRCKFLANFRGVSYSLDFVGIQFQISSHGLHITTFLISEEGDSATGDSASGNAGPSQERTSGAG